MSQSVFRQALFDPNHAIPKTLKGAQGDPAGKRFNVYRNNVISSLKEALRASFPAIETRLGAESFSAMASAYVRAHPPQDPRMMYFGHELPDFLARAPQVAHMGDLPDLARLELALRESYHAADTPAFDPSIFASLPPEDLARSQLRFAPSLRLLSSQWPIADIWQACQDAAPVPQQQNPQEICIMRPEYDPMVRAITHEEAMFIRLAQTSMPLGDILERIEPSAPQFDFGALLTLLLQGNALSALVPPPASPRF